MPDPLLSSRAWRNVAPDLKSPEKLITSVYRTVLDRDPDPVGLVNYANSIYDGATLQSVIKSFMSSAEYKKKVSEKLLSATDEQASELFPADFKPSRGEAGKSYSARRASGFLSRYLSGATVLDIGYKGYDNPEGITVVPHAIGVDLDYPGYEGLRLPFEDGSVDAVFSSHCLEHIADYRAAIGDWLRVLKVGGFLICIVPSQLLYEKKRRPPSNYNSDHKRFYTPAKLLAEVEESLPENSFRVRHLEDNDRGYDYRIGPEVHAVGCYEIVLVLEKISLPGWKIAD